MYVALLYSREEPSLVGRETYRIAYDDIVEEDEILESLSRASRDNSSSSLDGPLKLQKVAESRRWGRDWRSNSGHVEDVVKETTKEDVS
jgi:hypothetical protein